MIKFKGFVSLRNKLLFVMTVATVVAALVFLTVRMLGNFLVWRYYLDEATKQERAERCVEDFQNYVFENKLSVNDSEAIAEWSGGLYVDIILYKDSNLVYAPEWFEQVEEESSEDVETEDVFINPNVSAGVEDAELAKDKNGILEDGWFSGDRGFEQYLTEEALAEYRNVLDGLLDGNRELSPVYFVDGTLLITVVDYAEEFGYNLVMAISIISAFFVLAVIMIFNFTGTATRVNRLAQNVKQVESGNTEMPIVLDGNDELTALARDVNSMRNAVVENMRKERQAWEANSALITAMSHDIRTPLTVILGYLDLIELQNEDPANLEYIEACKENTMRLKALSDDMFSYFLVFGKQDGELENATVQSADVLRQMIAEHTHLLVEGGYFFETEDGVGQCEIYADTMYLGRVVGNIFSNLKKYADSAEAIRIAFEREGDCLAVSFTNAIKQDDTKPESNRIGIKTCEKIMEKMNGSFLFVEENGRFTARLVLSTSSPL